MSAKPMDFNEAFQISAAKLEEAIEMNRTAKLLPEGSASQSALEDGRWRRRRKPKPNVFWLTVTANVFFNAKTEIEAGDNR